MAEIQPAFDSWTRSPWVKWSWLLVLGVVVALSLDYHWRRLPTTAAGYFSRGRADYLLGDYESAIGNLSRSIELAPGDAEAYIWRGEAYAKLDEMGLAMPDLAKALQLRPDYDKAHAAMADGLAAAWDTEGAIAEYSAAIAIEPNYGRCYLERGKMLFDAGRWDEAATDFRRASVLLIRENQITAQLLLWTARARAGDAKGATAELTRVVKSGRMKTNRFWNAVHFLAGEVSEKEYLEATVSAASDDIGVDHAEACFLAATKRILSGDRSGALPLLRSILESEDVDSYAYGRARATLSDLLAGLQPMRVDDARRGKLNLAPETGLEVTAVTAGGPAEAAGLRPGSILTAIGGTDAGQDSFVSFLARAAPGSTVELSIIDGSGTRVSVPLALRLDSSAPTK